MIKINNIFKFLKKEKKEPKELKNDFSLVDLNEVFNVENFNEWFKKPKENSYASKNIFLRTDKLDDAFFFEYFESFEGINKGSDVAYSTHFNSTYDFKNKVRKDWIKKISEK